MYSIKFVRRSATVSVPPPPHLPFASPISSPPNWPAHPCQYCLLLPPPLPHMALPSQLFLAHCATFPPPSPDQFSPNQSSSPGATAGDGGRMGWMQTSPPLILLLRFLRGILAIKMLCHSMFAQLGQFLPHSVITVLLASGFCPPPPTFAGVYFITTITAG